MPTEVIFAKIAIGLMLAVGGFALSVYGLYRPLKRRDTVGLAAFLVGGVVSASGVTLILV